MMSPDRGIPDPNRLQIPSSLYIDHTCSYDQRDLPLTVYRRPDPVPRRRIEPLRDASPLSAARQESDDLSQIVARKIFAAIMAGHFPEGGILPNEHTLGETLGVSRTALREAIKGLSSKGMLETRRRRGTQVTDSSQWTMIDGEVIGWTRKDPGNAVSEELWQGLSVVMPEIARLAARSRHTTRPGDATSQGASATSDIVSLLAHLARTSGNRFLASFASISLMSLARDDAAFLDQQLAGVSDELTGRLCREIAAGNEEAAARSMGEIFGQETVSAMAMAAI
jgi:DNA-binding GntR family transcriptional regulator